MNYNAAAIEILTSILGIFLLILGLLLPKDRKSTVGYVSLLGLAAILVFSFFNNGSPQVFTKGLFAADALSVFFKQIFLMAAILVTLMSLSYVSSLSDSGNEFFTLIVFALTGSMIMVSSNDFITLYIGLELMTIIFVVLTAFDKRSPVSAEAGIKYILLGAISSAVLLYGMSLMYGLSGSVTFTGVRSFLETGCNEPMAVLAVILLTAGLGFKISAVPFHMWSPDIYEGAPTPITAFLASASKAAGFAVLVRLLVQAAAPSSAVLRLLLPLLSVLSMVIGNITALPQTNIKRMLAFSSISQAGYILLGVIAYSKTGLGAMLYYLLLYVFANTGAFSAVIAFSNQTGEEKIESFRGMWKRSPYLAAVLMLSLLSMAGIPPAAGFIGKFYLFTEIVRQNAVWLALLAIGMSVVSIYYYIGVIRVMLAAEPSDQTPIRIPASLKLAMGISAAATLILGVFPGPATEWTLRIAGLFMK